MASAHEGITIRPAELHDAEAIADIYNHYIRTTVITFEEKPVTAAEIARRIGEVQAASLPWLIAEKGSEVAE